MTFVTFNQPIPQYPSEKIEKIVQTIAYVIKKLGRSSGNRLLVTKLIWAADRFHVRRYGRTVTESHYVAMKNGPVSSQSLDVMNINHRSLMGGDLEFTASAFEVQRYDAVLLSDPGEDLLSDTDAWALDRAVDSFGSWNQFKLAEASHDYPEWDRHREAFGKDGTNRVSCDIIALDFFEDPARDSFFSEDPTILESARQIFIENQRML